MIFNYFVNIIMKIKPLEVVLNALEMRGLSSTIEPTFVSFEGSGLNVDILQNEGIIINHIYEKINKYGR